MASAEIKVILDGDSRGLVKSFKDAGKEIEQLGNDLNANINASGVVGLADKLNKVTVSANTASDAIKKTAGSVAALDYNPAVQLEVALTKVFAGINAGADAAGEFKTALVDLGNARLPLTSINQYEAAIRKIKLGITEVSFANIAPIPASVTGSVEKNISAVKLLENQLARLKRIASGNLGFNDLVRVNKLIDQTQGQLTRLNKGFGSLGKSSVDATGDLINLGRVVQDAPFGFLGIANNLNPLIEGFKRTASSAGGLKGGLKALGSSLLGAGGLSLAVSLVSTGLIVFGDKLFGAGKAAKEAEDANKSLKDSIKGIFEAAGQEAATAAGLIGVLRNEAETRERKIAALKELKELQPEYFGQLKLEAGAVSGLDAAYQAYLANLRNVIAVKIKQAQLEAKITELLNLQGASLTRNEKKLIDGVKNFQKQLGEQTRGLSGAPSFIDEIIRNDQKKLDKINEDIKGFLDDITELSKGVKVKIDTKNANKDADKFFNATLARAKALSDFIDKTTVRVGNFVLDPELPKEEKLRQALEFIERALNRTAGFGGGGLRLKIPIQMELSAIKLQKTAKYFEDQRKNALEFREDLEKEINRLTARNPILIAFQNNKKQLEDNQKLMKDALRSGDFEGILNAIISIQQQGGALLGKLAAQAANVASTLNTILTPAFTSLFQAITNGENPLKAFFKSIQQAIGQLIQRMIQAVIQALILRAILGGKAGSFGDLFKSFAGFRAEGGPVAAGRSYVVGEKGPEIFTPNGSGRIIPNNGIQGVQGIESAAAIPVPSIFMRGRDAYLQWSRQQGYNNRNV